MKRGIQFAGIMLLVLALACLYVGAEGFLTIRPAAAYEDMGVHTFSPYQTYPTQVKNTAGGRQGRLHPTKTVWYTTGRRMDRGISGRMKSSTETRRKRWWRQENVWNGGCCLSGKAENISRSKVIRPRGVTYSTSSGATGEWSCFPLPIWLYMAVCGLA